MSDKGKVNHLGSPTSSGTTPEEEQSNGSLTASSYSTTLTVIQRANDLVLTTSSPNDMPENYLGNDTFGFRRYVANRNQLSGATAVNNITDLDGDLSHDDADDLATVDSDFSTDNILQQGLGLVLRAPSVENQPPPVLSATTNHIQHNHNWQSNKHSVKSRLLYLLNTGVLSDVTFIVGGSSLLSSISASTLATPERIVAHKFVLSMSSAVFDAMFNGRMAADDDSAIEIPDVEPSAFKALLKFIYTDEISVDSDTVMSILYTAKKYSVPALEQECVEYLKDNINCDNVFMLLAQARLFDEPVLANMCLESIDKNTTEALASEGFTELDLDTLCLVLSRDSLGVRECKLFSAICRWAESMCVRQSLENTPENKRKVLDKAVRMIRYPLMTVEEFALQVAQSKILTDTELVELFLYFTLNPKPSITFIDQPRNCLTGKEQVVSRFCQVDHRWGYSGTSDRIK